jgi:ABC-2 type transport system ATP-binding protein
MTLATDSAPPRAPALVPVLRVTDAARAFGATRALDGVSLELKPGELLALLGPNGAGKTTLIRAITGRLRLDRGAIELMGRTLGPTNGRESLGIVPQEVALYPLLTPRENLEAFGELQGVPKPQLAERVKWALEWTGLAERARDLVKTFSGGMKRRLNIACGVLHRPKVVLLDEPTVGVDPQSKERIYEMLEGLRAEGASLLMTTHQLEEAEARCERIVIIDHGHVIAAGTLAELIERTVGGRRAVTLTLASALAQPPAGFTLNGGGSALHAEVGDVAAELPALLERARAAGARIEDVEVRRHGLHSVFLHLTGKELRE